jgi:hypothetical protein
MERPARRPRSTDKLRLVVVTALVHSTRAATAGAAAARVAIPVQPEAPAVKAAMAERL